MKITYLGHSSFKISFNCGTEIITDPYDEKMVGYAMPRLNTNLVTISHHHGDHNYLKAVNGYEKVLDKEGEFNFNDIKIIGYTASHDDVGGRKRGTVVIYTFTQNGVKVAHMGDIGEVSEEVAENLKGVDVLMIPVGGNYTINARQAKWYVDKIKPKTVIPMHYAITGGKIDISPLKDFTSLFLNETVVNETGDTFTYKPESEMKIVVLKKSE